MVVWQSTLEARDIRHGRDSSQGPEENETWKMSLGYCDILHFERVWKGSNTNWEVKATAMNMSQLHEKTLHSFYPFYFRGVNLNMETNLRGLWHFTTMSVARNICIYWWWGMGLKFEKTGFSVIMIAVFFLILTKREMSNFGKIHYLIMWVIVLACTVIINQRISEPYFKVSVSI